MKAQDVIDSLVEAVDAPPPPAIVQRVQYAQEDKDIVTACLIGEAGGEGVQGMTAVLNVICNRAKNDPRKYHQVVLKPYQFSMFNRVTVNKKGTVSDIVTAARKHPMWARASLLVNQAYNKELPDMTQGSTHYHNLTVTPSWSKKLPLKTTVGHHKFYKESSDLRSVA